MKKMIVAALAVAMMSSVASAALIGNTQGTKTNPIAKNPGGSIKIGYERFQDSEGRQIASEVDFTDEYFVVSAKKFSKGASLVKSIAFVDDSNDGYCLKISLNQDYNNDISRYTEKTYYDENGNEIPYSNVVFSELAIKAKKTVKNADDDKILTKGREYKFDGTGKLYAQVGYQYTRKWTWTADMNPQAPYRVGDRLPAEYVLNGYSYTDSAGKDQVAGRKGLVTLNSDDYDLTVQYDTTMAFKFEDGTVNDTVYSYAVINATYGDVAYTEGRVYDGDKVIYNYTQSVNTSILKAYPDAEIEFVNMKTSDLPATCYFELYADEDEYVYKVENGKLVKSGLKWDEDVYAWVGKYRTPCTYVISDIPLSLTPARDEVNVSEIEVIAPIEVVPSVPVVVVNPETGR